MHSSNKCERSTDDSVILSMVEIHTPNCPLLVNADVKVKCAELRGTVYPRYDVFLLRYLLIIVETDGSLEFCQNVLKRKAYIVLYCIGKKMHPYSF